MSEAVVWLTIFVLSVFVGIEVISKVSSTLHTPLMSGANAIHGIILLGAILVTGCCRCSCARSPRPRRRGRADAYLGPGRLPDLRGRLHPRAQGALRPEDRAPGQP